MRLALTGNPNSGKTTMFNTLTGRNEKIGNWSGVTVDRKESEVKKAYFEGGEKLIAVDLPGAYSICLHPLVLQLLGHLIRNFRVRSGLWELFYSSLQQVLQLDFLYIRLERL